MNKYARLAKIIEYTVIELAMLDIPEDVYVHILHELDHACSNAICMEYLPASLGSDTIGHANTGN